MKNRYAFAFVIGLLAAPSVAQPVEPGPAGPAPLGPPPATLGPGGPGPDRVGPVGPGPAGPGPFAVAPISPGPFGPVGPGVRPPGRISGSQAPRPVIADLPFDQAVPMPPTPVIPADVPVPMTPPAPPVMASPFFNEGRLPVERMAFEFAQDRGRDREAELRERERERESQMYSEGYNAALDGRYDRAVVFFNRVIEARGSRIDAALYWKAFSQNRLGQRSEALATLAELIKTSPNSTYRKHAAALEAEVRRDIGQPVRPQDSTDDEVKLMALQALQHTAPEQAVPMLEKVLEGTASPKVKQRALFVLAQSSSPRAREVLRNYAKGGSTPELQSQAIQYLGVHGGTEHRALLQEIYASTPDVDIKRRILRAFMQANDKDRLLKAAQGEQNIELRAEAVNQLGNMNAQEELSQLYVKETSVDVKRRIIRSMQNSGSIERLIELAKSEQNPDLRRDAVRALGNMRSSRTADVLVQIYGSETNLDVRKAVITSLANQQNSAALVALARKEQDVNMKKELVGRLSNMHNDKVATDYMIELLGK